MSLPGLVPEVCSRVVHLQMPQFVQAGRNETETALLASAPVLRGGAAAFI